MIRAQTLQLFSIFALHGLWKLMWFVQFCHACVQACKDHVCADLSPYQNHGQFCGEKCVAWDIKVGVFFFVGEVCLQSCMLCMYFVFLFLLLFFLLCMYFVFLFLLFFLFLLCMYFVFLLVFFLLCMYFVFLFSLLFFCFLSCSLYSSSCKIKTHKTCEDVEFMYLVFTHMLGENYRRWLRSLCDVIWLLINSLLGWFFTNHVVSAESY